jgi:hypothetical protein
VLAAGALMAQEGELFSERTRAAGIGVNASTRGVSVVDFNTDGLPDLFVSNLDASNQLYRNEGNLRFAAVGRIPTLTGTGATMLSIWADFDNDGTQEVFLGGRRIRSRLLGPYPTFTDLTPTANIELTANVISAVALDYDLDGWLDLYLACLDQPNKLYRNLGNLLFEEVGADAGADQVGLAMGTLAFDYDLDGDSDLYLVHDGKQPNTLLRNDGGYFTDVSAESRANVIGDGMGVDAADYDGDGDFDLYVTNLFFNYLLRNEGDGTFTEIALDSGVADLGMGWGCAWLDYNNDARPDLYVGNETKFQVRGERLPNILYRNDGDRFRPAAPSSASVNSVYSTYGTATADFDGDGRMDLFITNNGEPSQLFRNVTPDAGNWLALRLEATNGNRDAIGARATVHAGSGKDYVREVRAGGSFASQHDRMLHFGLGEMNGIDSVTILWRRGDTTVYRNLAANRHYTLSEGDGALTAVTVPPPHPLGVYPNPSRGGVWFTEPVAEVSVYSSYGEEVFRCDEARSSIHLPTGLAAGMYYLRGQRDGRTVVSAVRLISSD